MANKTVIQEKLEFLIQWAEMRKSAYTACAKVFNTDRAKYKSIGKLEEVEFFIKQLKDIASNNE